MMFGICTAVANAAAVKAAGWDYVEEHVQNLLQPQVSDDQWKALGPGVLPVIAANSLVTPKLKIVGPDVDTGLLEKYMSNAIKRARQTGIGTLVLGSGAARTIPEGFDRETASKQLIEFSRMSAELAAAAQITIVLEPLNQTESNLINSVAEAMRYVKAVDHPSFACLVDSYHFWLEDEPLENLRRAMPFIKHVHVADKEGRVAPGLSEKSDYRPFFRVLKQSGYDAAISFEGTPMENFSETAPKVLEFLKQQWGEA